MRLRVSIGMAVLIAAMLVAGAGAHVERSSYWPLPGADCSIHPCAGGRVPDARSLASALAGSRGSTTRVVCQPGSLKRLSASIGRARRFGYFVRPTDHRWLGGRAAARLLSLNRHLFARCRYREIQPAVTASQNNDRVVIMPGVYTEPTSRAARSIDPRCARYRTKNDQGTGAVSYAYQFYCPNDQNLVAVLGRAVGSGIDPQPAREDRHGIPNLGRCIRCNLQIEGSGVSADDVVIDAGRVASGNAAPLGAVKDVGVRADRADGFVLRNVLVRHAKEHDIYLLESNGYLLDRFKTFYAGEYGVLTFVEDHGRMQNCEAAGNGDSGLYPGAGAKTSAGRDTRFYPTFRYSQEVRWCDSHHNSSGYSGTDGNATLVDHNDFYGNALGFTTDVFTAPGHPGFPQQGDLVEYNNFYSNNFNPYAANSDVEPSVPVPVGTGLWIAGGNDNVVRYNHFYDNWRRGTMLFAAPNAAICGPSPVGRKLTGCDPAKISTSYNDRFYGNVMGVSPAGAKAANGTDFWWDSFPLNTGNCWYGNQAAPGSNVTTSPSFLPDCAHGTNPSLSLGTGGANEAELLACLATFTGAGYAHGGACSWFDTPAKPSGSAARGGARARSAAMTPAVRRTMCTLFARLPSRVCLGASPRQTR